MFNWTLTQGPSAFVPPFIRKYDIVKMSLYKVRSPRPSALEYNLLLQSNYGKLTARYGLKGQKTMNPQETYKRLKRIIILKNNYTINHFSLFFKMMLDSWPGITNDFINAFYCRGNYKNPN